MSQHLVVSLQEENKVLNTLVDTMKDEFAKELSAQEKRFHVKCMKCRGSRIY